MAGLPQFDHHVFHCTNERSPEDPKGSCALKKSAAIHQHAKERCAALGLKGKVRINKAGCLDACAHGPAVVVYGKKDPPEGVWYTIRTVEEMDEVIEQHLVNGKPVDRLRLPRAPSTPAPTT